MESSPLRLDDPVRIGGYRLMARLGAGGMADVFYSRASTGQPVAVKVFRATGGGAAACHREFQLARDAKADCTAPALGYGTSEAVSYLVTAYLPGYRCVATLTGTPTAQWLWRFGAALARVLAALHARGVVHCDVKPSNLLVRGDEVRMIDFGISRYVSEPSWDDQTVQCSPGWAAPEQLRAAPPTPAVDVFAWGCVLAYLAGGVHPFAARGGQEWFQLGAVGQTGPVRPASDAGCGRPLEPGAQPGRPAQRGRAERDLCRTPVRSRGGAHAYAHNRQLGEVAVDIIGRRLRFKPDPRSPETDQGDAGRQS